MYRDQSRVLWTRTRMYPSDCGPSLSTGKVSKNVNVISDQRITVCDSSALIVGMLVLDQNRPHALDVIRDSILPRNHLRFLKIVRTIVHAILGSLQGNRSGKLTSSFLIRRYISIRESKVTQLDPRLTSFIPGHQSAFTRNLSTGLKAERRETKDKVENVGPRLFCKSCDSPILVNF